MKKVLLAILFILSWLVLLTPTYATISSWVAKASMPTSRGQPVVIAGDDGLVYVMGGFDSAAEFTTVEAYDPTTDTWVMKSSMPQKTRGAAGAKGTDGTIYVISGVDPYPGAPNGSYVSGEVYGQNVKLSTVQAYDPTTDSWTLKASIPTPLWEADATTGDDGKVYVIGGEWQYGGNPTDKVQVYDPSTDSWTTETSMPTAREELCVVKGSDGLIYAIGGWDGSTAISTVEAYDPVTDTWTTKAPLPTALCQFGATLCSDNKIYVIGGGTSYLNNDPPFYSDIYSYDTSTDTWSTEVSMPTARRELGATTAHGKIYAIGGGNTYHSGPYGNWNEEATLPRYTLTIYSSPTGVAFTVDGVPRTTPWSDTYCEGASVSLVMPETHDGYEWSYWLEDGDTNRIKTVTVDTDITLTAVYEPAPKPVGGKASPINLPVSELELLTPYIGLIMLLVASVVTIVYVKKRKRRTETVS